MAYLGETPLDIPSHPMYSKYTPKDWALLWIRKYGGFDGAHHKDWVLDQVARILNGAPVIGVTAQWDEHEPEERFIVTSSDQYDNWVTESRGEFIDGEYEYEYSTGTAP